MFINHLKQKITSMLVVVSIMITGCGGSASPTPTAANDLLTKILARGTLVVSTDAAYPPQSELVAGATRAAKTKCAPNEYTAAEVTGYDVATAVEVAKRLGVEACFVIPPWSEITTGGWAGRWDISIGSMTITPDRLKVLYFAQPYYAAPAAIFIYKDNDSFTQPSDLSGKRVGVCSGCTYEEYLKGTLDIPGTKIDFIIKNAQTIGYDIDAPALEALSKGDGVILDGVLSSQPTGLQAIKDGLNIKQLGEPVFFEYIGMATDKKGNYNSLSLAAKVSEIVKQMHADGALAKLSQQYFGMDFTTAAAKFDIKALEQLP